METTWFRMLVGAAHGPYERGVGARVQAGYVVMRFQFGGSSVVVNMPTQAALMAEVTRRFADGQGFALATINLDHIAKMDRSPGFVDVYLGQDLVVADGWPVAALTRLARHPVELMPGSDLILPLCALAASQGVAVALVGSTEDALGAASAALQSRVPGLEVTYRHAPPMGFDPTGEAARAVCNEVAASGARLCFLAFGAPKQETLAAFARSHAPAVGFASIGAGLDFLAGRQRRAPKWVRRIGMEWFWRAASSPARLGPRYLRCFAILPARLVEALRLRRG